MKKGQYVMEYIVVTAIILAILSTTMYYFLGFSTDVTEEQAQVQSEKIGLELADAAETVFYSPGFAKRTLKLNVPMFVEDIYSENNDTIVIVSISDTGLQHMIFPTNVPVIFKQGSEDIHGGKFVVQKQSDFVAICSGTACTCLSNETLYCNNSFDDDCDGWTDLCDDDCGTDVDTDTYTAECGDCQDNDININPGEQEQCDAVDHDCQGGNYNGLVHDACQTVCTLDGYIWTANGGQLNCCGDDSGEANPYENPEVLVDGFDNDCDGEVDEAAGPPPILVGFTTLVNQTGQKGYDETNGTYSQTSFNQTLNAVQLNSGQTQGAYTSFIFDTDTSANWQEINWTKGGPYGEELPANQAVETKWLSGNIDMTGNVLLFHLNNDASYGESSGLNGFINDFSGQGNNGRIGNSNANSVPTFTDGKIHGGYYFDGDDDMIGVPDNPSISGLFAVTVSVWINPSDWPLLCSGAPCYKFIVAKSNWADNREYRFRYESADQHVVWHVSDDGSNLAEANISITHLPVDQWYHIAGTWDSATGVSYIYRNGVLWDQKSLVAASLFDGVANLSVGSSANSGAGDTRDDFDGIIDEVAVWNRALSPNEIMDLYRRGAMRLNLTLRSCDDSACAGESWVEINDSPPQSLSVANNQYIQYDFDFTTENTSYRPDLYNVTIDYLG